MRPTSCRIEQDPRPRRLAAWVWSGAEVSRSPTAALAAIYLPLPPDTPLPLLAAQPWRFTEPMTMSSPFDHAPAQPQPRARSSADNPGDAPGHAGRRRAGSRSSSDRQAELAAVERLGQAARRVRLDPPEAQQRAERSLVEPLAAVLGPVALLEDPDLLGDDGFGSVDEDVRRTEVAVELRDLVLEDQVVAERVPGQLAGEPVVLVRVVAVVREDDVGSDRVP